MIEKVRNDIIRLRGNKIKFRYNGSRNQIEEFEGIITNCYSYVFIIDLGVSKKSFSYADVLIGNLEVNI
ncbi:MAG: Veg family protein [Bacilli bacterium]|nr:Veg family protein [Bacilli bacterium]